MTVRAMIIGSQLLDERGRSEHQMVTDGIAIMHEIGQPRCMGPSGRNGLGRILFTERVSIDPFQPLYVPGLSH